MSKYAIVVVGYNRVNSIARLLSSLEKVNYEDDSIDLIISIDNSGTDIVEQYAREYVWKFGRKIIKTYPERLGLRKHILTCGDYVKDYEAIAVFEDDIYVSPNFYNFMKQSVQFYKNEDNIAGISLYSHLWNEYSSRPFVPEKNRYDTFFMMYAQSWGQIWIKKQWFDFKKWYLNNSLDLESYSELPNHIKDWPESSWLKYHIAYCILNKKYFVYPYVSLTTNFTEIGQHCKVKTSVYQVPILYDDYNIKYEFSEFDISNQNDAVYYDGFFERVGMGRYIGIDEKEVTMDLYGGKDVNTYKRYLISCKHLNYKIKKSFSLELRPHERNIIDGIKGDDIYIYDTKEIMKNSYDNDYDLSRWYYDSRVFDYKYINKVISKIFIKKIKEENILKIIKKLIK